MGTLYLRHTESNEQLAIPGGDTVLLNIPSADHANYLTSNTVEPDFDNYGFQIVFLSGRDYSVNGSQLTPVLGTGLVFGSSPLHEVRSVFSIVDGKTVMMSHVISQGDGSSTFGVQGRGPGEPGGKRFPGLVLMKNSR